MVIQTVLQDPEKTVSFAAEELKRYLSVMLPPEGVFSVSFEISNPILPHDGFSICMQPDGGTVTANNPRSALLAVYDYLHCLGCRFLGPLPDNEVIPRIQPAQLALSYQKTPVLQHRGVCIEGANSLENVLNFVDWLPKVGYNSFFLQFKVPYAFFSRWYHHENNPCLPPQPFSYSDAIDCMKRVEAECDKRGLLLHKVGHGWTGEVLCGRATGSWDAVDCVLSPEQLEMTAMVNGRRGLHQGIPTNTNLCLSNPNAVAKFVELVVAYAKENPSVDYLHIWLGDEYNNVCQCGRCAKTTVSEQYVQLLNEIDRAFIRENIPTKIVFLLYQELLWPATTHRLEHPDRFLLMFAPISRTFEHSYELEGVPADVPPYRANHNVLPTDIRENLAFLRKWQTVYPGEGFVYDYPLGRAHYGDLGYLHISRIISQDIKKLEQLRLNGYISCQELRVAMPNSLPNYVMGYTLLDPRTDVQTLIDEYMQSAYPQKPEMAADFLEALSRLSSCDYLNGKGSRIDPALAERYETIRQVCRRFRVQTLPPGQYWQILRYHSQYCEYLADALASLARGQQEIANAKYTRFRDWICQQEPQYQPWLDVYRILEVTQKYTGFKIEE